MESQAGSIVIMETLPLAALSTPSECPREAASLQKNFKPCSVESFESHTFQLLPKTTDASVKATNFPEFTANTHSTSDTNILVEEETSSAKTELEQPVSHQTQMLLLASQTGLDSSDLENFSNDFACVVSSGITEEETSVSIPGAEGILQNQKFYGVCRICANERGKVLLFSSEGVAHRLVEKIHRCLPIQISIGDDLPHQICDECASKLEVCFDFINLSIVGSDKLKAIISSRSKLKVHLDDHKVVREISEEKSELESGFQMLSTIENSSSQPTLSQTNGENSHSTSVADANSETQSDSKERQWSCSECDYKASRQSSLSLHKANKHSAEAWRNTNGLVPLLKENSVKESRDSFVCEFCNKTFLSKTKWEKHILYHTKIFELPEEISHACSECNVVFSDSKDLQEHQKSVHSCELESKFNCEECNKSFRSARSLDIHRATHSKETPYLCDICGKSFKHGSNLRSHKRSHSDLKDVHRHSCDLCPKSFPSKFHLNEHKNVHLDVTPYPCGVCGKRFHRRIQLRQHKIIHSQSSYECPQCGVTFNRRGNMTQHMKRHMKELKYTCKVCKDSFQTLSEVVQHRRQHTEQDVSDVAEESTSAQSDAKFQCEICSKELSNRRTLDYHIRSFHTQERPFSCQYCSKSFVSREGCLVHERHHTGEKPYSCPECRMSFRCSSNLAQHLRIHQEDRPWACDHCPKSFKRKGVLLVHMRTHNGEKPFCCDVCGRRFTQKNDMLKHQQTHTAAKQTFVCGDCGWSFHSRKELNKHRRAHHIGLRMESNLTCMPVLPSTSQAVVIMDDFSQFPITIVEEGSNVIVHQIEELGSTGQIVQVDPNQSSTHLVHFTDSLPQAVGSESAILSIQTQGDPTLQVQDETTQKTVIAQNW